MAKKTNDSIGHNNEDGLLRDYVIKCAKLVKEQQEINGDLKEVLREAKDAGFKKMAIRAAIKKLMMNAEQRQACDEIDAETARITELCSDLPLFGGGQSQAA
jgi:uncharacterized protein (UPF0335 family)